MTKKARKLISQEWVTLNRKRILAKRRETEHIRWNKGAAGNIETEWCRRAREDLLKRRGDGQCK